MNRPPMDRSQAARIEKKAIELGVRVRTFEAATGGWIVVFLDGPYELCSHYAAALSRLRYEEKTLGSAVARLLR